MYKEEDEIYIQLKSFEELVVLRVRPALSGLGDGVGFSDLLVRILRRRRRIRGGDGGGRSETGQSHASLV